MLMAAAKKIIFKGNVQGVGFRFTANRYAQRHQLAGYVKNLPDGTVEMVAQGPENAIEACIDDLKDYFGAQIRDTDIENLSPQSQYQDFKITF